MKKDGHSQESNLRQSVERLRLAGPLMDAPPSELYNCGLFQSSYLGCKPGQRKTFPLLPLPRMILIGFEILLEKTFKIFVDGHQ